jgi:hypothetical protein
MTTAISTHHPLTAAAFLFDGHDSIGELTQALEDNAVVGTFDQSLKHLSRAGRKAVDRQVATVVNGMLNLDLGDLVVNGLGKITDLIAAARRTLAAAESREIVELSTHTISCAHHPHVDVLVNDARVATLRFDLALKFVVKGLSGTVSNGRLVSLHAGACDVVGSLAAEGRQLVKREGHFQLPLLIKLGDGVPLLRSRTEPTSAQAPAVKAEPAGTVLVEDASTEVRPAQPAEAKPAQADAEPSSKDKG